MMETPILSLLLCEYLCSWEVVEDSSFIYFIESAKIQLAKDVEDNPFSFQIISCLYPFIFSQSNLTLKTYSQTVSL